MNNKKNWKIINFHEHIESMSESADLLNTMKKNGNFKCVLLGSPNYTIFGGNDDGFYGYERNNLEILNIAKKYPDKFIAFPTLNPLDDGNLEKLKWYISQGARGMKLYYGFTGPWHTTRIDSPRMDSVFEYCQKEEIPIMFHISMMVFYGEFTSLMEKFPKLKVIIPHFMLLLYDKEGLSKMEDLFKKYQNLYADVSFGQLKFLISGFINISNNFKVFRDFIIKYKERFLFGTDTVVTGFKLRSGFPFTENIKIYRDFLEKNKFIFPDFFTQNLENLETLKPIAKDKLFDGLNLDEETLRNIYEINPSKVLTKIYKPHVLEKIEYKYDTDYLKVCGAGDFFEHRSKERVFSEGSVPAAIFYTFVNKTYSILLKFIEKIVGIKLLVSVDDSQALNISLKTKQLIEKLFTKKIIRKIERKPQIYYDEPRIVRYEVEVPQLLSDISLYSDGCGFLGHSGGADLTEDGAIMKAIGEGVERLCLGVYREKELFFSSYNQIKNIAVDPASFSGISPRQRNKEEFLNINEKSLFRWAYGFSLLSGKKTLIPAQLVYLGYKYQVGEPFICSPISTGAAAAGSFDEAVYRGVCETVERDAFMITYFNKISPPTINADIINDEGFQRILTSLKLYNLELHIVDITTDINIPSVMAVIIDRSGKTHSIHVGTKTDLIVKEAVRGAVLEAIRGRLGFLSLPIATAEAIKKREVLERDVSQIKTFADRCLFWSPQKMIKEIEFIFNGKEERISKEESEKYTDATSKEKLKIVTDILGDKKIDAYWVDITMPAVKKERIYVAKVVCPKLQPLYLNESRKHLWGERIFNTPVALGYRNKPSSERDLNQTPHPFL